MQLNASSVGLNKSLKDWNIMGVHKPPLDEDCLVYRYDLIQKSNGVSIVKWVEISRFNGSLFDCDMDSYGVVLFWISTLISTSEGTTNPLLLELTDDEKGLDS